LGKQEVMPQVKEMNENLLHEVQRFQEIEKVEFLHVNDTALLYLRTCIEKAHFCGVVG